MQILVTGSRGTLGTKICLELELHNIDFVRYSQFLSLDDVEWEKVTHIINCAAVIPSSNESLESYWMGNVQFVAELLRYSANKHLIHFSSLSEQYKFDDYQITKLLGANLLTCNSHIFSSLQIIPVPTLEDKSLINYLIEKSKSEKVTVDRLKYSFMEVATLAKLIIQSIQKNEKVNVINSYIEKDLYEEVKLKVDSENILEGSVIDRTSVDDNLVTFSPYLFNDISKKHSIC
jgi:hypothetical protein